MATYHIQATENLHTVRADEHKYEMLTVQSVSARSSYAVIKLLKEGKTVGTYRLDKIIGWRIQ